ncbi:BREX system ATP-binding domain-containing protein [Paenibacillus roseipurpureus]|uniref:DUF2791 family P-loop domain-containing protein n=1 Tax=Paenibacillus roseopurpureus TaxID=2918901 RepID=A0AA96LQ88_9BACL|nr:BREX system ATP-binding domain-containing protein [Paenibacillus sp. MBLB1832]WNR45149.1 DUF2791 family P-loop domain-containing protein [Paenibacillus sp. MBLB1832]
MKTREPAQTKVLEVERELLLDALDQVAQSGIIPPSTAHLLDVGTGPYLEYAERELFQELAMHGGATVKLFEGTYGAGKTHLLQLLRERALSSGMIVASFDLSQDLRLEDWKQVTQYFLEEMEWISNGKTIKSLPNILEQLHLQNSDQTIRLKRAKLPYPGMQQAMWWGVNRTLLGDASKFLIHNYLTGQRVPAAELKRFGLTGVKGYLSARNAELIMKTVLSGLSELGLPGVLLLFDENERTLQPKGRMPTRKLKIAANLMRRFIDGCTTGALPGTVAIFAVLPGFIGMCTEEYPALGQRLLPPNTEFTKAWRLTTTSLDKINVLPTPEAFLLNAVQLFCSHVELLGGRTQGLEEELNEKGTVVLQQQADDGHKRMLMKTLAYHSLLRLT